MRPFSSELDQTAEAVKDLQVFIAHQTSVAPLWVAYVSIQGPLHSSVYAKE